jgi:3-oxoacyl-[acyl-carrier protein] reductase
MDKRVCVVTGSSSGIGAATVERFAREGWNVAINFSRDPAPARRIAETCGAAGADVLTHQADISEDAACRAFAAAVEARWGRCDVLVNNAGATKFVDARDLDGLSADDFQRIFSVNVVGPFQMARAFARLMRKTPGGGIVNVSSIASLLGQGSSIAYAASKGALNTLTLSLARTLGPEIRVNAVAPGMVDSSWLRTGLGEERFAARRDAYIGRAALRDLINPEDVADAIFWLGAGAKKTSGEVLVVDAGARTGRN